MMTLPLGLLDWHSCSFALFAAIAIAFAVAVVATDNVVRMAFYLTVSLGATAGLFFLAGSQFVGAMQLMIYVGGTLVLLIFGVMLTAQSQFVSMKTGAGEWVAGGVLGAALLVLLLRAGWSVESWRTPRVDRDKIPAAAVENSAALGLGLVGVRVDSLDEPNVTLRRGLSGYLLPFVIISMHLLVVLVGAGYLARTKTRSTTTPLPVVRRTDRKRDFFVAAGLASGMVVNGLLAAACFGSSSIRLDGIGGQLGSQLNALSAATPSWLPPVLGVLFVLNILCLVAVWGWQKWGATGMVVVPFLQAAAVANSPLGVVWGLILLVLLLIPAVALIGLLFKGGSESAWSKME